jgi:hypothetical protein
MMGSVERLNGQCLCGAVKFTALPKKMEMDVCHCSICRRWSGGTFMAVNCGRSVEIEGEAALGIYVSSEWGERLFCSNCGSSLFWRDRNDGMTVVSMQAFDNPERFHFAEEIFIDNKPANYDFANRTHRMTGEEFLAATAAKQEAEHG